MSIRIINLVIAFAVLVFIVWIANPALYRASNLISTIVAFMLTVGSLAWVVYAYHLVTLKWHENMVTRGWR